MAISVHTAPIQRGNFGKVGSEEYGTWRDSREKESDGYGPHSLPRNTFELKEDDQLLQSMRSTLEGDREGRAN